MTAAGDEVPGFPGLPADGLDLDRFMAAVDTARRTGALAFTIRFQDDEEPTVWIATATHKIDLRTGRPVPAKGTVGKKVHTVAAALGPLGAVLQLCEKLLDGGRCEYCGKPTGFEPVDIGDMPLAQSICWVQWDPELKVYRRGCAGG